MKLKPKDLYIGMLVVTTDADNGQVYTIGHIFPNSTGVEIQWMEGERQSIQGIDYSLLMKPTLKQIEYSLWAYGPLVSFDQILNF